MHVTRTSGLSPLAIVLPQPQLPRPRSAVSSVLSSPRTPRTPSCGSNVLFAAPSNRNSTDSWNSSNAPDELEWDWKPEQLRLLSRTLDALPPHLVTPFNGPTPPSNLLDKIARGVSQAKGPIDWPHSIRATRVKLIELSRARAKEECALATEVLSNHMEGPNACYSGSVGNTFIKRPLYRQSSMDFINATELKGNNGVACLVDRLHDRLAPGTPYHPYSRRLSRPYRDTLSPPYSTDPPSLISPSTPSSSTLNTLSSFSTYNRILRRTGSTLSSTSASSIMSSNSGLGFSDPRLRRVRRSDSLCPPTPPPKDKRISSSAQKENMKRVSPTVGVKRAPSFGTLAQEIKLQRNTGSALNEDEANRDLSSYPSSDEEEKMRTRSSKKMRVKNPAVLDLPISMSTGIPPTSPGTRISPSSLKQSKVKTKGAPSACQDCMPSPKLPTHKSKKRNGDVQSDAKFTSDQPKKVQPMNLKRNPSILGAELRSPTSVPPRVTTLSPARHGCIISSVTTDTSPSATPPKLKTLRRVRRLAPGRRISFGSLVTPGEDADGEAEADDDADQKERRRQRELCQLGSAFQLH